MSLPRGAVGWSAICNYFLVFYFSLLFHKLFEPSKKNIFYPKEIIEKRTITINKIICYDKSGRHTNYRKQLVPPKVAYRMLYSTKICPFGPVSSFYQNYDSYLICSDENCSF